MKYTFCKDDDEVRVLKKISCYDYLFHIVEVKSKNGKKAQHLAFEDGTLVEANIDWDDADSWLFLQEIIGSYIAGKEGELLIRN